MITSVRQEVVENGRRVVEAADAERTAFVAVGAVDEGNVNKFPLGD